jgi:formylglycine-generating enzyme required for sulfatase activity
VSWCGAPWKRCQQAWELTPLQALRIDPQRVWNGKAEVPVTTSEWYDALGRLRRVREANGSETRYLVSAQPKFPPCSQLNLPPS